MIRKTAFIALILVFMITLIPIGFNSQASVTGILRQGTVVSGGLGHTIALRSNGSIMVWGTNRQLQLGLGSDVAERLTPTQIQGITAVSVAAGHAFSVALTSAGEVYAWGGNVQASPQIVRGIRNVAAIAAGQSDILALREDGTVWQWSMDVGNPTRVSGLRDIAAITAGAMHYFALTHNGDVYAWGSNAHGQLGIGTTRDRSAPSKIDGLTEIRHISAGIAHSLAVSAQGKVFAWGQNTNGELAREASSFSSVPLEVTQISNAVQVAAGMGSSLALTANGQLYAWGNGEFGQLGYGESASTIISPTLIRNLSASPANIGAGTHHGFYTSINGEIFTWGRNNFGQLGNNRNANMNVPQRISFNVLSSPSYATNTFAGASPWAVDELTRLLAMNRMPLYFWSSYRTDLTRAEFTYMTVSFYEQLRNTTVRLNPQNAPQFRDIEGHLFEEYILKAYQLSFISGRSERRFDPDSTITRQETARIISSFVSTMRSARIPQGNTDRLAGIYRDYDDISVWARPYVAYVHDNNIMHGSGNRFRPLQNMTREESMVIMYRTLLRFNWR